MIQVASKLEDGKLLDSVSMAEQSKYSLKTIQNVTHKALEPYIIKLMYFGRKRRFYGNQKTVREAYKI